MSVVEVEKEPSLVGESDSESEGSFSSVATDRRASALPRYGLRR